MIREVAVAEPSEAKKMKETLQRYGVEKSIYDRGPTWSGVPDDTDG